MTDAGCERSLGEITTGTSVGGARSARPVGTAG